MTALLATLLLAACGGGGDDGDGVASLGEDTGTEEDGTTATTLSEEEQEEALLDWAACMRSEGIDMPDPQIDANGRGGIAITREQDSGDDGEGASPGPMDREAFEAAAEECGDPPFFGRELTEEDREEMEEQALAFAECMREHGIEDFPDPDFSDRGPGAGPRTQEGRIDDDGESGDGPKIAIAGPFGEFQMDDPEEIAAFEACQEDGGFGPPGAAGGPTGVAPAVSAGST